MKGKEIETWTWVDVADGSSLRPFLETLLEILVTVFKTKDRLPREDATTLYHGPILSSN